jgi:hypothetical protein
VLSRITGRLPAYCRLPIDYSWMYSLTGRLPAYCRLPIDYPWMYSRHRLSSFPLHISTSHLVNPSECTPLPSRHPRAARFACTTTSVSTAPTCSTSRQATNLSATSPLNVLLHLNPCCGLLRRRPRTTLWSVTPRFPRCKEM